MSMIDVWNISEIAPRLNITGSHWWQVDIGSDKGLITKAAFTWDAKGSATTVRQPRRDIEI